MTGSDRHSELDANLHQPLRTRIVAYISTRGEATFSELKQALEVTDGNLEAHIKKLRAAGYITTYKQKGEGRPQTFYQLTEDGKQAFRQYVDQLQNLLNL